MKYLVPTPQSIAIGLLIVRVGLGIMMMVHGFPKVMGGPEQWTGLGGSMAVFGITFAPMMWGAAAAFTELIGGAMLVLGLAVRPVSAMLLFTMFVAASVHLIGGDGIKVASHAIELGIVFIGMIFAGGGMWTLDERLFDSA